MTTIGDDDLIFCDECGQYRPADEFEDIFVDDDDSNICQNCQDYLEHECDPDDPDIGGEA